MIQIVIVCIVIILFYLLYKKMKKKEDFVNYTGSDEVFLIDDKKHSEEPHYDVEYTILPTQYIKRCGKNKTYWNYTNYSKLDSNKCPDKDPKNNNTYRCSTGGTYATYNSNTLTPEQKAYANKLWGKAISKRGPGYYACVQGCGGTCIVSRKNGSVMRNIACKPDCEKLCDSLKDCDSYLYDKKGKCHLFKFNEGNIAKYRCKKPFQEGEWHGDIKSSAKATVTKFVGTQLNPGDVIALWNPINSRFLKMNYQRNIVGSEPTPKNNFDTNWKNCMWMVIKISKNDIALWNIATRRFATINGDARNAEGTTTVYDNPIEPSDWSARIKVISNGDLTVSLWNMTLRMFYRMNSNGNVDIARMDNPNNIPSGWTWERWEPVVLIKNKGCYTASDITNIGNGNTSMECGRIAAKKGLYNFGISNGGQCVSLLNDPNKKSNNCSDYKGGTGSLNVYRMNNKLYETLRSSEGNIEYNMQYHILEDAYRGLLGSCGSKGACGSGIGTYPKTSNYFISNKKACTWRFVPKGEDETVKKESSCPSKENVSGNNSSEKDNKVINYGDILTIRSKNDDWLVTCNLSHCGSPAYLSVSAKKYNGPSNIFAGNAQYWKFESFDGKKTGPVNMRDKFRLINLWGATSSLNTCWHYNCGGVYYEGYGVNTAKINSSNYNGVTSRWTVEEMKEEVTYKSFGNKRCDSTDSYKRFKITDLDECKKKCNNDPNCNTIAIGPTCVTYKNCVMGSRTQSWGYNYYQKRDSMEVDYNITKAPRETVGKHLEGSGKQTWPGTVEEAIKIAESYGLVPGSTLRYIQNSGGRAYFYAGGNVSGRAGSENWRIDSMEEDYVEGVIKNGRGLYFTGLTKNTKLDLQVSKDGNNWTSFAHFNTNTGKPSAINNPYITLGGWWSCAANTGNCSGVIYAKSGKQTDYKYRAVAS